MPGPGIVTILPVTPPRSSWHSRCKFRPTRPCGDVDLNSQADANNAVGTLVVTLTAGTEEKKMPTTLARLFGLGRPRKGDDRAFGLRLAAMLAEADEPERGLEAACRLALRTTSCQVAMVATWVHAGGTPHLELVAGRQRGQDAQPLLAALSGRHSPLFDLDDGPRWICLQEDQFQPGAPLLRRFDLAWMLVLPLSGARRGFALLAGHESDFDSRHPLVRDARLIWLAAGRRLSKDPAAPTAAAGATTYSPWPGSEAWATAPAALALVLPDRVVAANERAHELLAANVGHEGQDWSPWLLGAVGRLDLGEKSSEILTASGSRGHCLEVTVTPVTDRTQPRLVAIQAADRVDEDPADHEATLRLLGHELRTPLTAMKTSLDLVLRRDTGELNDDQERFLGATRRNLQRLNRLLDDLLDAKRAEAGHLAIHCETVDLGALLGEDLTLHAVACREKGIELDATGVPAEFRACVDADKVQQILHNVVSNAIKYTSNGGLVRVWLQERSESVPGIGARLARRFKLPLDAFTLVVEDNGIGMSPEYMEILFQPFSREERPGVSRLPGAGLGLHITRGLIEAHGGEVRLTSQPDQGTTVWLVMPREPGSGRVLTAGRELDVHYSHAVAAGQTVEPVFIDVRRRLERVQPWETEAAANQVCEFLGRLAGDRGRGVSGDSCCWQLASGLWVGLALDPQRLAAAWQVATSAPESSLILAGTSWQALDEVKTSNPVTIDSGPSPVTGGP